MKIEYRTTVVFVKDIGRSKKFYTEVLQQKIAVDQGPNVGFAGGLAIWDMRHALTSVYGNSKPIPQEAGHGNLELYFETDDMDGLVKRLNSAGVKLLGGVIEHSWSQKVVRFEDPDGHLVEVGEALPATMGRLHRMGMSKKDIASKLSLPAQIVEFFLDPANK